MKVPILDLKRLYAPLEKELKSVFDVCFEHQRWILGPEVEIFEQRFSKYLGVKYAIGVSSGTDALTLALRAVAIKNSKGDFFSDEDLVITTPFTFVATGEAILRCGAKVLFVDVDEDIFNISPDFIEMALSEFDDIKGIIVVHLYGQSARIDEIKRIADRYGLFVIEDCAQSFGAKFKDKFLGTWGDLGCFSFFPTKNLGGMGDGGMVVTNDEELASIVRMLRNHGGKDKYNIQYLGYNARLDTLQAGFLNVLLRHVDEFINNRRKISKWYKEFLDGLSLIRLPVELQDAYHTYNQYTLRLLGDVLTRNSLLEYLTKQSIGAAVYYPVLLSEMEAFKGRFLVPSAGLSHAEHLSRTVLSVPICPCFENIEISYVAEQIRGFFKK